MNKKSIIQVLCRRYLSHLNDVAKKVGLGVWIENIIQANKRNECVATTEDVDMLSRLVNDERVKRHDVPKYLGISYRKCVDEEVFDSEIRNLGNQGTYSKVDVIVAGATKYGKELQEE